ncbi:hypothetical protein AAC387_Pa01g0442 [Persea americana]
MTENQQERRRRERESREKYSDSKTREKKEKRKSKLIEQRNHNSVSENFIDMKAHIYASVVAIAVSKKDHSSVSLCGACRPNVCFVM